jgi:hypothetical protein
MLKTVKYEIRYEIPYYIPCMYEHINMQLKLAGCDSRLSLLLALELFGIPAYIFNKKSGTSLVTAKSSFKLGYKKMEKTLGFKQSIKEYSTKEEGLEGIRENINNNRLFIASGTPYYLPYSSHYYHPNFIEIYENQNIGVVDHWIGILGISDDELLVYETTPQNIVTKIPISDFVLFWLGNKQFKEFEKWDTGSNFLTYGYLDIRDIKYFDSHRTLELLRKSIKTTAYEYMKGRIITEGDYVGYYGYRSIERYIEDLLHFAEQDFKTIPLKQINECLFEMKFSRYFYRDILKDITKIDLEHRKLYESLYEELEDIIREFERVALTLSIKISRKIVFKEQIQLLIKELVILLEKEKIFYSKILTIHKDVALLD